MDLKFITERNDTRQPGPSNIEYWRVVTSRTERTKKCNALLQRRLPGQHDAHDRRCTRAQHREELRTGHPWHAFVGDDDIDVIRLEHATAGEITRVINQLSAGGQAEGGGSAAKLIADDRTNSVLLSGDKNQRLKLRALVAHLDTPLETGSGTRVRYLKYGDAEKIAGKLKDQLQATAAQGGAAPGAAASADKSTSIWADPANNALVITAPSKQMRQLMDIVDHLEIRRLEVQVEAIIVEITGSSNVDLGVNWFVDGSNQNAPVGGFVSPIGTSGPSIATIAAAALNPTGAAATRAQLEATWCWP